MKTSAWYRLLRGTSTRRSVSEAAILVLFGLAMISIGLGGMMGVPWTSPQVSPWWHAPALILAGVVLTFKRRHPVATLLIALPMIVVDAWLGGSIGMVAVLIDLVYSVALRAGSMAVRRLGVTIGVLTVGSASAAFIVTGDAMFAAVVFIQAFAILGTPLWWGTSVRQQAQLTRLAAARSEDLQNLAHLRQDEAVREERTRMARDLHDTLSSNLSAIAIHAEAALNPPAGGAAVAAAADAGGAGTDPTASPDGVRAGPASHDTSRERHALDEIRRASLSALEEMGTMVLLLRTGDDEVTAPARIGDLDALVAYARGTGLQIDFQATALDQADLPAAVEHAAYRILQESLTNAVKHCPGGRTSVAVRMHDSNIEVVVNSAPVTAPRDSSIAPSPGVGLTHMRERAEMLGGTFRAGWTSEPAHGWHVQASLPVREVAG